MNMLKAAVCAAISCVPVAAALAAELPKELAPRYAGLLKAIKTVDTKSFDSYFAPDFVNVDPSGKSVKRDEFLKGVHGMFQGVKSCDAKETTKKVTKQGDTMAVDFDFTFQMKGKPGGDLMAHEVGTDYWKKVGGKWLLVKTVDTKFDVTPAAKPRAVGKGK